MALFKKSNLYQQVKASSGYEYEANVRNFAAQELIKEAQAALPGTKTYDIFLSHSSVDAIYIKALRDELVEAGFSTYVDWIDDPQLDRSKVTSETAQTLRNRMQSCSSLLYATSSSAKNSVWMPWELGYMDAFTASRVAIVPLLEDDEQDQYFLGREYLGMYPYLDKTGSSLYIHRWSKTWVGFDSWIKGGNPAYHG